jgi:hypothetical protein
MSAQMPLLRSDVPINAGPSPFAAQPGISKVSLSPTSPVPPQTMPPAPPPAPGAVPQQLPAHSASFAGAAATVPWTNAPGAGVAQRPLSPAQQQLVQRLSEQTIGAEAWTVVIESFLNTDGADAGAAGQGARHSGPRQEDETGGNLSPPAYQ